MIIELPWVSASLNPNNRNGTHWSWAHAAKSKRTADARILTLQAMQVHRKTAGGAGGPVPLTVTFVAPDKRRRDMDNLFAALKADLDGVALALGIDDSEFEPVTLRRGEPVRHGRVILEISC